MIADLLRAGSLNLLFSTGICAVALGASRLLHGRWPTAHQTLWSLVLVRLVLPPGLTHPWSVGALLHLWPTRRAWIGSDAMGVPTSAGLVAPTLAASPPVDMWAWLLAGAWVTGCALLLVVDARRVRTCRRLLRTAEPVTTPWVSRRLALWCRRLGIRRPIRVVSAEARVSPFTMGLARPIIFIPSALLRHAQRNALASALAHELAHVARGDALWLTLERVVRRLYFFHPVAWLAGQRLHEGRERLSDATVVTHGLMRTRAYARGLLEVHQLDLRGVEAPTLHTTERGLKVRILDIVKTSATRHTNRRLVAAVALLAGAFLIPLSAGTPTVATASSPSTAERTAATLDNPLPGRKVSLGYGQTTHPIEHTPYFHRGVDLVAPAGTPVKAPADGVVETATTEYEPARNSGTVIVLDHGHGLKTFYAHLGTLEVKPGQQVARGAILARVGMSGLTTGPHLHFEVWRDGQHVDPGSVLTSFGKTAH